MLERERHIKYFKRCLQCMPSRYSCYDQQRLPLLYFILTGLDSLSAIDIALSQTEQAQIIDWLYNYVLHSDGGFSPSTTFNTNLSSSHVTMTYSALICLIMLNDNLSGINRPLLLKNLAKFQNKTTGGIKASPTEETDLRFTYCALAIHYILQGKRGDVASDFSVEKAVDFVKNCQSYQGGFGQTPGLEAHGGSTYCAVASLVMSGAEIPNEGKLMQWLMLRQERVVDRDLPSCGFNGRSNKIADSCYTFWVGSCLGMLEKSALIHTPYLQQFLNDCQASMVGGFSKWRNEDTPDPMHSSLALLGSGNFDHMFSDEVQAVCPYLGITASTHQKLSEIEFEVYIPSVTSNEHLTRSTPLFDNPVFAFMKKLLRLLPRQKSILGAIAVGLVAYLIVKQMPVGKLE